MKKYLLVLLMVLLLITSCKTKKTMNNYDYGDIDYYVCGIYMEVEKQTTMAYYDENPKLLFKFENKDEMGLFSNYSGSGSCAFTFMNGQRVVNNDGAFKCSGSFEAEPINNLHSKMKVYPIYYKNGEYTFDTSVSETVSLSKGTIYQYQTEFTNNKQQYLIQIKLSII